MFLFSRLENAAKIDTLFKKPDKPAAAPSNRGAGGGGGDGGARKTDAGPGPKLGEKAQAPDADSLEVLFQGMVDPAVSDQKKESRGQGGGGDGGGGGGGDAASETDADPHAMQSKAPAKEAAPAPTAAPQETSGAKKKKKGEGKKEGASAEEEDKASEDGKKKVSASDDKIKKADSKSNEVTDELQAKQKRDGAAGMPVAATDAKDHQATGGSEPSAATETVPMLTGDFNDVRGEGKPGGSNVQEVWQAAPEPEPIYDEIALDEGPSFDHGSVRSAPAPKTKAAARTKAPTAIAPAPIVARPAPAAAVAPKPTFYGDGDDDEGWWGTDETAIGVAAVGAGVGKGVGEGESWWGTDEAAAVGEEAEGWGTDETAKAGVGGAGVARVAAVGAGAAAAVGEGQGEDEGWGTDEEAEAAKPASVPGAAAAAVAAVADKAAGGDAKTATAKPATPTAALAKTAAEPAVDGKPAAPTPAGGAGPQSLKLDGGGALPPVAANAPAAAAGVQTVAHELGAGMAQGVTETHEAVANVSDAALADVGANQPVPTDHLQQDFQANPGGGGGGGGVQARSRQHKADPMSEAQSKMADLQAKADWKSEAIFNEQIAKAENLGTVATQKSATLESYSAVEEEKAKATQKKAEADARKHVDDEKGKQEVTIESLKAELAASVETEKQELTQQNEKAKTDVHTQFNQKRQTLLDKEKSEDARVAADIQVKQAQIQRDIAAQKTAMQAHIKSQQELITQQAGVEKETNITTAAGDGVTVIATGEDQAGKTIQQGESDAGELNTKGAAEAGNARQLGREKAAQARSEAAAKAAGIRSGAGDNGVWDSIKSVFGAGMTDSMADEAISDGELRATMATDTAEETAKKIEDQAAASAGKARADATSQAEKLRASAKKDAENLKARAVTANAAVDGKVALSMTKAQTDAITEGAKMDVDGAKMATDAQVAAEKAKVDNAIGVTTTIAKLTTDEVTAVGKLEADLQKSLAGVQTKFDATQKKLESGKAGDIKNLEKMVHKAESDIDNASVEAAKHVDGIRKQAEKQAQAEVAKQLAQITMHTQAALSQIEHMARTAINNIKATAEAAATMLDIDGKEGLSSVEREGEIQKAAIDAQAQRDEKKLETDGSKGRDEMHKHTEAIVASFGEKNHELAGELDKVLTVDLTDSKKAAEDLEEAMDGWGTDEDAIYAALASVGDDPIKMRAIKAAYKKKFGKDLDAELEDEMDGTELRRAKALESQDKVRIAVAELDDAQDGWGTNEEQIHKTLEKMKDLSPDDQARVSSEYRKMTGVRLTTMLKDELGGDDLAQANKELGELKQPEDKRVAIPEAELPALEKKVKKDVGELRKAFNGCGTDEGGVLKALEGKSEKEIQVIKDMYLEEYGESLEDRLEDEMSGTDLKEATAKLSADPVQIAVSKMQNAADGWGTDEKKIHETLEGITDPEVRLKVAEEYEKQTGHTLKGMIADEMSGADAEIADTLLLPDNHERTIKVAAIKLDDAANGGFLGTGAGTDEDAIYKVLESAKTQTERDEIAAAYKARTGVTLDTMLASELSGAELDIATGLQTGDEMKVSVARLKNAADGLGTDEKAIFKELGKYPDDPDHPENQAKRKELEALYNKSYGPDADPPGMSLDDMLKDEMSDMDLTKAEELKEKGEVSDVTELEWAMDGAGTDEDAIKAVLKGKKGEGLTKDEISKLRESWDAKHPDGPSLESALGDELSGRDQHEVDMMLKGKPETPAEMLQQAKENYEYERGSGSTGFSVGAMDVFGGDAGSDLDHDHQALMDLEAKLKAEGKVTVNDKGELVDVAGAKLTKEEQAKLDDKTEFQDINVANYQAAKDAVTGVMAQVGMVVATVAVGILTAGAGAAAIVAAEAVAEVAAETALEVVAEVVIESAAETAAEALAEAATEAIVEVAAETIAETATEVAVESAAEAGIETVGEGMVEEALPGLVEEVAPELVEQAVAETAAEEAAAETVAETVAEETVGETAAETAGETAAEEGTESAATQAAKTMSKPMQKALSALAGGATNVTIKSAMLGDAYGIEDMGIDIGKAILQAATAGLLETERLKSVLAVAESMGLDPTKLLGQVVNAAVTGGAGGALNSIGEVVFNDDLWRTGDIGKELAIAMGKGALSGFVGGALGHLQNTAMEKVGFLGIAMGTPVTAGQAIFKGVVTGAAGALTPMAVSGIWDPAVFEGRWEDVLKRFGMAGLTGAIQGAGDGLGSFIDEPYAKARAAAEKDAHENPDSTPESQSKAAEEAFNEELGKRAAELAKQKSGGETAPAPEEAAPVVAKRDGEAPAPVSTQAIEEGVARAEKAAIPELEATAKAQTEAAAPAAPETAAAATEAPAPSAATSEEPPAGPMREMAEATAAEIVTKAAEESTGTKVDAAALEEPAVQKVAEEAQAPKEETHAAAPTATDEASALSPATEETAATPKASEDGGETAAVAKPAASPEAEEFLVGPKTKEQEAVLAKADEIVAKAEAENDSIISVEAARDLRAEGGKFVPEANLAPEHAELPDQKLAQQKQTNEENRTKEAAPAPPTETTAPAVVETAAPGGVVLEGAATPSPADVATLQEMVVRVASTEAATMPTAEMDAQRALEIRTHEIRALMDIQESMGIPRGEGMDQNLVTRANRQDDMVASLHAARAELPSDMQVLADFMAEDRKQANATGKPMTEGDHAAWMELAHESGFPRAVIEALPPEQRLLVAGFSPEEIAAHFTPRDVDADVIQDPKHPERSTGARHDADTGLKPEGDVSSDGTIRRPMSVAEAQRAVDINATLFESFQEGGQFGKLIPEKAVGAAMSGDSEYGAGKGHQVGGDVGELSNTDRTADRGDGPVTSVDQFKTAGLDYPSAETSGYITDPAQVTAQTPLEMGPAITGDPGLHRVEGTITQGIFDAAEVAVGKGVLAQATVQAEALARAAADGQGPHIPTMLELGTQGATPTTKDDALPHVMARTRDSDADTKTGLGYSTTERMDMEVVPNQELTINSRHNAQELPDDARITATNSEGAHITALVRDEHGEFVMTPEVQADPKLKAYYEKLLADNQELIAKKNTPPPAAPPAPEALPVVAAVPELAPAIAAAPDSPIAEVAKAIGAEAETAAPGLPQSPQEAYDQAKVAKTGDAAITPVLSEHIPELLEAQVAAREGADPALQQKRNTFEKAVALSPEASAAIKPALDAMCEKALDYITRMHAEDAHDRIANLGSTTEKGYAGAVGKDYDTMLAVLKEGNARERLLALGAFQELVGNDALADGGLAKMKQVFAAAPSGVEGEGGNRFGLAEVEKLEERLDVYNERTGPKEKRTAKGLFGPLEDENAAYAAAKSENMDTKLPALEADKVAEYLGASSDGATGLTGFGEDSPLARTKMTVAEAQAEGFALSPREVAAAGGPDAVIPWLIGEVANMVDPSKPFIADAKEQSLPLKAGISGTTFRFMQTAELLGADPAMGRLAAMVALNPIDAHSFHEIASAAQGFTGNSYDPSQPYKDSAIGLPHDVLENIATSQGTSVAELNRVALAAPVRPEEGGAPAPIVVETPDEARQALAALQDKTEVVKVDDHGDKLAIEVQTAEGESAAVQIKVEAPVEEGVTGAHALADEATAIQVAAENDNRPLNETETVNVAKLNDEMRGAYDDAWGATEVNAAATTGAESLQAQDLQALKDSAVTPEADATAQSLAAATGKSVATEGTPRKDPNIEEIAGPRKDLAGAAHELEGGPQVLEPTSGVSVTVSNDVVESAGRPLMETVEAAQPDAPGTKKGLDALNNEGAYDYRVDKAKQIRADIENGTENQMSPDVSPEVRDLMKGYIGNMTDEQMVAIQGYTSQDYEAINAVMRGRSDDQQTELLQGYIGAVRAGLGALPAYEGEVYRGTNMSERTWAQWEKAYEGGGVVSDPAFSSSSKNVDVAEDFLANNRAEGKVPVVCTIQSRTGKQIEFLSKTANEAEVLFDANAKFKIIHIETVVGPDGLPRREVFMKEVLDDPNGVKA